MKKIPNEFLDEVLNQLRNVKQCANGEYCACCPAHDDKKASLSITNGDKDYLVFNCFAGCSYEAIINNLDLSNISKNTYKNTYKKIYENIKVTTTKKKIIATYDYIDVNNVLQYQKVRYLNKDFTIRRPDPDDDGKWLYNRHNVDLIPYNLQNLLKNERVFLVEGEKDVDTLARFGIVATCSPDGAGVKGKFNDCLTQYFIDKYVYIIPDNDQTGYNFANEEAKKLLNKAKEIKVLNLLKAYPELQDHGDISDLIEIKKLDYTKAEDLEKLNELLKELIDTTEVYENKTNEVEVKLSERFNNKYVVINYKLHKVISDDKTLEVCDFVPYVTKILYKEDKVYYMIKAVDADSESEEIQVDTKDLKDCEFNRRWKHKSLIILRSNKIRNYIIEAIDYSSQHKSVEREEIYTALDCIKIKNKEAFLHCNGAIGSGQDYNNIKVELGDSKIQRYKFNADYSSEELHEGFKASLSLLAIHDLKATLLTNALAFLTPLNYYFKKLNILPTFYLYLGGQSQSGKSELAGFVLNYFGVEFGADKMPANFEDTTVSVQNNAIKVKNSLFVVDDFNTKNQKDTKQMLKTFNMLATLYGDRQPRNRADKVGGTLDKGTAYGNCLMTGEILPDTLQSRLARGIVINMYRKGKNADKKYYNFVTENRNKLNHVMHAYIKDLTKQDEEELLTKLKTMYRDKLKELESSDYDYPRTKKSLSYLYVAHEMYLNFVSKYFTKIDNEAIKTSRTNFAQIIIEVLKDQSKMLEAKDPAVLFLTEFISLVDEHKLELHRYFLGSDKKEFGGESDCGYYDDDFYYINYNKVYKAFVKSFKDKNNEYIPSSQEVLNLLIEKDVISKNSNGKYKIEVNTRIDIKSELNLNNLNKKSIPIRLTHFSKLKIEELTGVKINNAPDSDSEELFKNYVKITTKRVI